MIFDSREHLQRLETVDAQLLKEIVRGRERARRELKVFYCQVENFLCRLFQCPHGKVNLSFLRQERKLDEPAFQDQGKYGMGPESSTNFLRAAITAGRWKRSQKRSISWRNSSWGTGLMNLFAATRVTASNFAICVAVERATRRASPSPASCAM